MPIGPSSSFRPSSSIPRPTSPAPQPNVAEALKGTESHGDSEDFQTQKDVSRLKEHGSDPKGHGELQSVSFPEPKKR